MANAVIGLGGFAVAVLVLNLTAEPFGSRACAGVIAGFSRRQPDDLCGDGWP